MAPACVYHNLCALSCICTLACFVVRVCARACVVAHAGVACGIDWIAQSVQSTQHRYDVIQHCL
eukprot:128274-Prorocentrum_lima.AAC.1